MMKKKESSKKFRGIKIKAQYARSCPERLLGLTGRKKITPLYLETRWGIHTFGMVTDIDILVLDEVNKIVRLKEKLKKNRFFFWDFRYGKVLELPPGFIRREKVRVGDRINLSFR